LIKLVVLEVYAIWLECTKNANFFFISPFERLVAEHVVKVAASGIDDDSPRCIDDRTGIRWAPVSVRLVKERMSLIKPE